MSELSPQTESALKELENRFQIEVEHTIDVDGRATKIGIPGNLQWSAMAAAHPELAQILHGKKLPDEFDAGDDELQMHSDVIGLAMAIGLVGRKNVTGELLLRCVDIAKKMVDPERENGFLYILFEAHPRFKHSFIAALAESATGDENLGAGEAGTTGKSPTLN